MIRYHDGTSFEQPWMGLSVKCAPQHVTAVNADLIAREAEIESSKVETTQCLIRATAPLAELLGYRADLGKLTAGTARHSMWLSHYAPIDSPPPGGQAA
jgi:translation elongation factor EF-G